MDENLGVSHAALLRKQGWDIARVTEEGLSRASDSELWQHVLAEGRFLITLDLDFSDLRRIRPGTHPGVLLIRVPRKSRSGVFHVLERLVAEGILPTLPGCLAVADLTRTRVRRPPKE